MCDEVVKPPLGLDPMGIFWERRRCAILEAVNRYGEQGLIIPVRWVEEYNKIIVFQEAT